jgi:hypothetical protein
MKLFGAFLLEEPCDPKEVYIALRKDGSAVLTSSMPTRPRKPLSDKELESLFTREGLEPFSLSRLGGVMLTADVYSGRKMADIMFREEPDAGLPFSGWVFLSSEEAPDLTSEERGLNLHDPRSILRLAPEVAQYLHLPPGTHLVRTGSRTFEPKFE